MYSERSARTTWALALLLAAGCAADTLLPPGLSPPATVTATALSTSGIRVDWVAGTAEPLDRYRIERREDLAGSFTLLAEVDPGSTSFFDTGLNADRFYGYRIVAINREGDRSHPSVVAGAHTAPLPGIQITTGLTGDTDPTIADPNGYRVVLSGPRDSSLSVGTSDDVLITPLPAGDYTITLRDVLSTCTISGDTVRQITVIDTGLVTRASTFFAATCTDPTRGRIVATVEVTGDSTDADGYQVSYAGIVPGDTMPVLGGQLVGGTGGTIALNALRPGEYEVTLDDVDLPCLLSGGASTVNVAPQSVDTVAFAVTCPDRGGGNPAAPLVYQNLFAPQTAAQGQNVSLDVSLDLSAIPTQRLGVIQATIHYDPAVLTFVSASQPPGGRLGTPTVNSALPGELTWLGFAAIPGPSGLFPAARFTFTVTGAAGTTARTRTTIDLTSDDEGVAALDTLFRTVEDTFTVGSGGGGSNQPPTAQAGGPYNGTAGSPIALSSAGSVDPDGTIAGYQWFFGDATTSTQANPAKTYAAAGSFTVTLMVTDDDGATASDQATVTVTGSGGGSNLPPIAEAGGPYTGQAGQAVSFTSAGSSDPDGTIGSFGWSFSDGSTGTGANPGKTFAAAGSYTATLTVTDNLGATGTDQATVTITGGGGGTSVSWTSAFGAFESVLGTVPMIVTLTLPQDIPETSGSPEALGSYAVDSLVWDPAILEYHSLTYASGGGTVNPTNATGGCKCKLVFTGVGLSPNTGNVPIATVRFKPKGTTGATTTPRFYLGTILSTPGLGSFNYRGVAQVVEGAVTLP